MLKISVFKTILTTVFWFLVILAGLVFVCSQCSFSNKNSVVKDYFTDGMTDVRHYCMCTDTDCQTLVLIQNIKACRQEFEKYGSIEHDLFDKSCIGFSNKNHIIEFEFPEKTVNIFYIHVDSKFIYTTHIVKTTVKE